jgi:hypothetical protein
MDGLAGGQASPAGAQPTQRILNVSVHSNCLKALDLGLAETHPRVSRDAFSEFNSGRWLTSYLELLSLIRS